MGNMREISIEECMRVSGGAEIVVTGSRITTPVYEQFHDSGSFTYRSFGGFGSNQGGDGGAPTLEAVDEGDDDGDGILNRDEEIVVNGPPRLADDWSEMTWAEFFCFGALELFANSSTMGSDGRGGGQYSVNLTSDLYCGTNVTGQNPDDPYFDPATDGVGHPR